MTPKEAYYHAKDVVKGRWPEGEAAIARSASWSYCYARWILQGRFTLGEAAIARGEWSYYYALDVLQGRFPEGEAVILNSAYAEDYCKVFRTKFEKVDWAVEGF